MARRRLLADAFWSGIYALPSEEREVVRHCTGDYVWAADTQPAPGGLRPLRDRPSLLAA